MTSDMLADSYADQLIREKHIDPSEKTKLAQAIKELLDSNLKLRHSHALIRYFIELGEKLSDKRRNS